MYYFDLLFHTFDLLSLLMRSHVQFFMDCGHTLGTVGLSSLMGDVLTYVILSGSRGGGGG